MERYTKNGKIILIINHVVAKRMEMFQVLVFGINLRIKVPRNI